MQLHFLIAFVPSPISRLYCMFGMSRIKPRGSHMPKMLDSRECPVREAIGRVMSDVCFFWRMLHCAFTELWMHWTVYWAHSQVPAWMLLSVNALQNTNAKHGEGLKNSELSGRRFLADPSEHHTAVGKSNESQATNAINSMLIKSNSEHSS